jgi:ABC-type transport system involved in cytochrome c biogenesis permease subunit
VRKPKLVLFLLAALAAIGGAGAIAPRAGAQEQAHAHQHAAPKMPAPHTWDPAMVELFARLPVQDDGRVKPFSTLARFTLLGMNGMSSTRTEAGDPLSATEWLMDCLFFPELAMRHPCFVVQDAEALDAVGISHEGRNRRDRYSYADLIEADAKMTELARAAAAKDPKELPSLDGQILNLWRNLRRFESLVESVAAALHAPAGHQSPAIAKVFGEESHPTLSQVIPRADDIRKALQTPDDAAHGHDPAADWLGALIQSRAGVTLLPPQRDAAVTAEWFTPGSLTEEILFRSTSPEDRAELSDQIAALGDLEAMYAQREDPAAFRARAEDFRARVVGVATTRGEYAKVPLEVAFYRLNPFTWALVLFCIAFVVLAAGSWVFPWRGFRALNAAATWGGLAFVVVGIAMRCVIRSRPPVSTLYETVLFITAIVVLVALVTERVSRRGIAGSAAPLLGAAGMFLANRYEAMDGVDTMPTLQAVLDTNFWLWTHVTTVTIGYGAGLLAGALGHVYLFARIFGLRKSDPGFFKGLTTMTYGVLCFGLLFSFVGTVLGGIWANDSWGRFWGWDPKENGALAIVIWELIVLHARMAGYIRGFGIAMMSVFGAAVVAASWWGVNLLGVGLHSYGFTSGILAALVSYFAFEGLVLLAGAGHYAISLLRGVPADGEPARTAEPALPGDPTLPSAG